MGDRQPSPPEVILELLPGDLKGEVPYIHSAANGHCAAAAASPPAAAAASPAVDALGGPLAVAGLRAGQGALRLAQLVVLPILLVG